MAHLLQRLRVFQIFISVTTISQYKTEDKVRENLIKMETTSIKLSLKVFKV